MKNSLTCKHPDALTLIEHATVNGFLNILLLRAQFLGGYVLLSSCEGKYPKSLPVPNTVFTVNSD
jgi:hypothetical protein